MAKNIKFSIDVEANTEKAKKKMEDLMRTMQKVQSGGSISKNLFDTDKMNKASEAAKELQKHLSAAMDVNTGRLNLSAFSASLKASGGDLKTYKKSLEDIGPSGYNAFLKVSKSIAMADAPIKKTNANLNEFITSLKNTARWQISSTILHGFMGSLQSAYGYAQDLNESLNNIRIVTGKSTDQMAEFAKQANASAKALSTTTANYTDAALIYYQQGLENDDVKERTDVTIKMANVARENATEVSSYMTAIWNNFNKEGSQSAEHFADVITKLGAATAASSAEIANGLEKFASISDTIGLSYDYATAALTTIVDKTRQSEDVVGTSLKTIFARMEGLKLGETLEDGTGLTKYSQALQVAGINIKDQNGELKDMDVILDEMGSKWQQLSRDQQVALAQTVGGTRQYNQLISLMDNYDSFKQNVNIAKTSDGELDKQSEIYAESWEAAEKRVKAAMEGIYSSILDDKFFIKLSNAFAVLLDGVKGFSNGLGGMRGILLTVGGFITQKLAKEAPAALNNIKQSLLQITGRAKDIATETQTKNLRNITEAADEAMTSQKTDQVELQYAMELKSLQLLAEQKLKYNQYSKDYSETEKTNAENVIASLETSSEMLSGMGKQYDNLRKKAESYNEAILNNNSHLSKNDFTTLSENLSNIGAASSNKGALKELKAQFDSIRNSEIKAGTEAQEFAKKMKFIVDSMKEHSDIKIPGLVFLSKKLEELSTTANITKEDIEKIFTGKTNGKNILDTAFGKSLKAEEETIQEALKAIQEIDDANLSMPEIQNVIDSLEQSGVIGTKSAIALRNYYTTIKDLGPHVATASEAIVQFGGALAQVNGFISSVTSLSTIFTDEDSTTIQKIGAVVGTTTAALALFNSVTKMTETLQSKNMITSVLYSKVQEIIGKHTVENTGKTGAQALAHIFLNKAMLSNLITLGLLVGAMVALTAIVWAVSAAFTYLAEHTAAGQLKTAQENAKELATALDDAKSAAEELQSAFSSYDTAVNALSDCTKGTKEWDNALRELNNEVLDLMTKYPELASMINNKGESAISKGDNGELIVEDWAREQLENGSNQRVDSARAASVQANRVVREKNINALAESANNKGIYGYADLIKEKGKFTKEDFKANYRKNESLYSNDPNNNEPIGEAELDALANTAVSVLESDKQLIQALENNTVATENENDALTSSLLQDNKKVQESGFASEIADITGDSYDTIYNDKLKEIDRWGKDGISQMDAASPKAKEIFSEYLQYAGLENAGYTLTDTTGDDAHREFKYKDTSGEEHKITLAAMQATRAAAEANELLGKNAEELAEKLTQLGNSTDKADIALLGLVGNKNLNDANSEQINALSDKVNSSGGINAYLDKEFEDGKDGKISDETAQKYGYETAKAMADAYLDALKIAKENLDPEKLAKDMGFEEEGKIYNTAGDHFKKLFEETLDPSEMTAGGMKNFSEAYKKIFESGGEDALNLIDGILKVTGEKSDEISALIGETDWSDWDSIEDFQNSCKDLGVEIDNGIILDLQRMNGAVKNFDASKFCEQLANITKLIKDLETGDTISAEDYKSLGDGYENYFMLMADGTYKLVGAAEDFKESVMKATTDSLIDKMEEIKTSSADAQSQKDAADKALGGRSLEDLSKSQDDNGKYSSGDVNAQLGFLNQMGYNEDKIKAWQDSIEDGKTTTDVLQQIGDAVKETSEDYNNLTNEVDSSNAALRECREAYASTAESFEELQAMLDEKSIDEEAFTKAYTAMAEAERTEGLDSKEIKDYANYLKDLASSEEDVALGGEALSKDLANNSEAARDMSIQIQRMNKGIESLSENWDDWSSILRNSSKGSEEYFKASKEVKDSMSDLLDISSEFIDTDLVDSLANNAENMELMQRAAEGDGEAIDQLRQKALESIVMHMELENSVFTSEELWGEVQNLQSMLDAMGPITAGTEIDMSGIENGEAEFVTALNSMISEAGMSSAQVTAMLSGMGFQANFATQPQKIQQREPDVTTTHVRKVSRGTNPTKTTDSRGNPVDATVEDYDIIESKETTAGEAKEGFIDAFALETSPVGETRVPKIESVTRQASGSANNYSPSNSGGKSPSGSSGSGGGGGSQPKEAKKIDKKKNDEAEIDRYHVITEQLERLADQLDTVSKAKDRAFGAEKLKLMDKEIAKQNEIIQKNQEYASLLKKNRDSEKTQLASMGASFDANGVITNYNEIIKQNQADYGQYNAGIDHYNSLSGDAQEALDEQYSNMIDSYGNYYSDYNDFLEKTYAETAEKREEDFNKLLEDYESDQEEYESIMQTIQDAINEKFDEELAKVDYVIEIKVDVNDRDIKYLEFLLTELEDKDFHAAEAIANIGLQTENTLGKIENYRQGIQDIVSLATDGKKGIDDLLNGAVTLEELQAGGLTEDGLNQLEQYVDGLLDENETLRDMREKAWSQINDEFEEYLNNMDRGISKIEHLKNITQSYQNIVDIVGKKFLKVSNSLIDQMNQSVVSESQDLLQANKAKMEALQQSYDRLKSEDTTGWSDQAKKERNALLKNMEDELRSAKESFMSSWEDALQSAADRWGAAVDNIIEEMEDKLAGMYGSLSELQAAYDKASDLDSEYLADYNQIYELSKLTRDINNSIDDTDNIASKEEYKKLIEEINKIEADGTKLSEYDLSVLQKKFELKQAQMALEEAQNAKSSVNMVRGEDGNYSYVYTADDDAVEKAEQNYEDKLHEMQVLNADYINNLQSQIIQAQSDCAAALAEIKESDFNSYEEWREAVDRTQAYYDQKIDFYYSQLDGALGNNRELYTQDWQDYSDATGYKISADQDYVDKFEETNYAILTGFQTIEEAHSAWNEATQMALNDMSVAYSSWQNDVSATMSLAGSSIEDFADNMQNVSEKSREESQNMAESVEEMGSTMETVFSETISSMERWEELWGKKTELAIKNNEALIKSYNELKKAMVTDTDSGSGNNNNNNNGNDSGNGGSGDGQGGSGSGQGGSGGSNNANKVEGVAAAIWMDGSGVSGWQTGAERANRLSEKGVQAAQDYINAHGPNGDIFSAWNSKRDQLKNFYYGSFDTGGYTGDWGDKSGKLALLHSKELVLNSDDTDKFLQAIDMAREISDMIDVNARAASRMYDELYSPGRGFSGSGEIIQQIEINAQFPDAVDHSEIEAAFNNLINTASQYAYRSK